MFAVGVRGGIGVVYDPASGLTHRPTRDLPLGPVKLDGREVTTWPIIAVTDAFATAPLSVSWSPALPSEQPCPFCPEDESVTELPPTERVRLADVLAASSVLGVDICDSPRLSPRQLESLAGRLNAGGSCVISVTTASEQLEERADLLAGHVDAIRVGLRLASAHYQRGPGREEIDDARRGVQAALTLGLPVQIEALLLGPSAAQPQEIVDLAASVGAQGVTFFQRSRAVPGADVAGCERTTDEHAHALVDALTVPAGLTARLRTPESERERVVIRADGRVRRSSDRGEKVLTLRPVIQAADLVVDREGQAW